MSNEAAQQFLDLLLAAMTDAAVEGQCTQLQTTITPQGGRATLIRLIVVPEQLDYVRPAEGVGKFTKPM